MLFIELIARDKASWSEAARSDPDTLTLDEFLAFRHPESSHVTILLLVDELLDKLGVPIKFFYENLKYCMNILN